MDLYFNTDTNQYELYVNGELVEVAAVKIEADAIEGVKATFTVWVNVVNEKPE